jgi:hypothetical protein
MRASGVQRVRGKLFILDSAAAGLRCLKQGHCGICERTAAGALFILEFTISFQASRRHNLKLRGRPVDGDGEIHAHGEMQHKDFAVALHATMYRT